MDRSHDILSIFITYSCIEYCEKQTDQSQITLSIFIIYSCIHYPEKPNHHDGHDITERLLKVALNMIALNPLAP